MMKRYSLSLGSAACMTFGLLFMMQLLIATGQMALRVDEPVAVMPAVRDPIIDTPVEKEYEPVPPPEVMDIPATPGIDPTAEAIGPRIRLTPPPPIVGPTMNPAMPDGGLVELVSILPIYPDRMNTRGIEGYVVVQFTVTATGEVVDVIVMESSHRGFEKAAIQAMRKFKYKPNVVDGQPVAVSNLLKQFTFALER